MPRSYFCRDICVSIGGHILGMAPEKADVHADKEEFVLFLAPHQLSGLQPLEGGVVFSFQCF